MHSDQMRKDGSQYVHNRTTPGGRYDDSAGEVR